MTPEQVTQAIQDTIARFCPNNLLTPDQQTLVEEILRKVLFSKDLDDSLDFPHWQSQVTTLEQELTQRLTTLPSPPETDATGANPATLRFALLLLYWVAAEVAEVEFDNLPARLEFYRRGLTQAAAWALDTEGDHRVRELVLQLHVNLGVRLGQAGRVTEAIEQYQRGLDLALPRCNNPYCTPESPTSPPWLVKDTGENDPGVRFQLLRLYQVSTNTWYNLHHSHQVLALLPMVGLWTWAQARKVPKESNNMEAWAALLDNWSRYYLTNSPFFPNVTQAFQACFQTLLDWHDPKRPLRHFGFMPTATLLALSESLYGLEQARQNQLLQQTYNLLATLADSPEVETAQQLHQEQVRLQSLSLISFWRHPFRWWEWQQQETLTSNVTQQLATLAEKSDWQVAVKKVQKALTTWLQTEIWQRAPQPLASKLESLPNIVLGMLLASQSVHLKTGPEQLLKTWQTNPPWQTLESLTTAFAATHWQEWLRIDDPENPNKPVYRWTDAFRQQRLTVSDRLAKINQPLLQTWLKNLAQGEVKELTSQLETTWNEAQKTAKFFAQIFTALADLHYQKELFDEKQSTSEEATYRALAAVVLGDVDQQLEAVVSHWLFANLKETEMLKTFDYLKECFARIVTVTGNHTLSTLGEAVHDWAKVSLEETLTDSNLTGLEDLSGLTYSSVWTSPWATLGDSGKAAVKPDRSSRPVRFEHIWNLLERSRVGLLGLSFKFPQDQDDWAEKVGQALWQSLDISVREIINGHQPTDQEMWPPLQIWLQEITRLRLVHQPSTVAACSPQLSDHEALVQPFFDPTQRRLRILWLTQPEGLTLRELPDDCARQDLWENDSPLGVINQWTRGVNTLRPPPTRGSVPGPSPFPECSQMMESPPVKALAKTLADRANTAQLKQLTVIWPAPLGQLPWETLPNLEALLAREISIGHWLAVKKQKDDQEERTVWLVSDPSGQAQCMRQEQQWLARQFAARRPAVTVTAEAPCPSMFDALHRLRTHRQTYFIAHGQYDRANPLASRLSLHDGKQRYLPLWLCSVLPLTTELLVLSACESNLYGQETQGLLAPIGIGPSLAAAGVQTVVGTLWPCDGLAALCFAYYLDKFAQETPKAGEPKLPWHQLVARARKAVRDLTKEELMRLAETEWLLVEDKNDNDCLGTVRHYYFSPDKEIETGGRHSPSRGLSYWRRFKKERHPFQDLSYWGGFTVMGKMERE